MTTMTNGREATRDHQQNLGDFAFCEMLFSTVECCGVLSSTVNCRTLLWHAVHSVQYCPVTPSFADVSPFALYPPQSPTRRFPTTDAQRCVSETTFGP